MNEYYCAAICFLIGCIGVTSLFIGWAMMVFADAIYKVLDSIGSYINFQVQKEM